MTDAPGLYFLGLTWQHTRGSALIGWVKEDAEFIAERIAAFQEAEKQAEPQRERGESGVRAAARARVNDHSHGHTHTIEIPGTTEGLPDARRPEIAELSDGLLLSD